MRSLGNIDMGSHKLLNMVLDEKTDFPLNPVVGSFEFIRKRVMVCIDLVGSPTWIPLTQELNTYIHTQDEASTDWIINHDLGSNSVIVQIFDDENKVVHPNEIDVSLKDSTQVNFLTPVTGRAICILGDFMGLPKDDVRNTKEFSTSATWTFNHGLGFEPIIRCISNGAEIQPQSIVHQSINTAVITFENPRSGKAVAI